MTHSFNPSDDRAADEAGVPSDAPVPDAEREVPLDVDEPDTGPPVLDDDAG